MSLTLDDIVKVSLSVSQTGSVYSSLNLGLIIGTSNVISTTQRVKIYSSTNSMLADGFSTTSLEFLAAELYFSQSPQPSNVAIGVWNKAGSETALQAVTSCRQANNQWYACYICGAAKADILAVAPYIDSCKPLATYFYTTHDSDVINGVAGNIMQTLQRQSTHRSLGQYSTANVQTAGYETGASGGSTDISAGTANKFQIAVDGDTTPKTVTLTLSNCTSGPAIATEMQSEIRVLAGAYAIISVSYTNNVYVITSGTTGTSSKIRITAGSSNDVTAILKTGIANGAVDTDGTQTYIDSAASIMGYAMGANTGLTNSAYDLAYKSEPGVSTESLDETQLATIKGYNGNVYINRGSTYNLFEQGTTADGTNYDSIINLDVLTNNIQIAVLNALTSATKIPQTDGGLNTLMLAIKSPCENAKNVGFIAPGIWNAAAIGSLNTGDALSIGYKIMSATIADQSETDRTARKAPNIYVAVKLAGAIEYVVIGITVNN